MKKFTNLLIVASLALAGAVMAQQPTPEESPSKKAPDKKPPAEVKPAPTRPPKTEAPAVKEPAVKEPALTESPAATKPEKKAPPIHKPTPAVAPEMKTEKPVASATPAPKKQESPRLKDMKSPADNAKTSPSATPVTAKATATPAAPKTTATPVVAAATATPAAAKATATPAASAPATTASASPAPSVAQTSPTQSVNPTAAAKKPDVQKVEQIKQQHVNFHAQPRPDKVPAVTFSANFRIQGSDRWQGPRYEVYRSYHPERHDQGWYRSRYQRVELISGGYYYYNNNYWYPAWGYNPSNEYYAYDAPIYAGKHAEPPDKVIADVQAVLQEMGYYKGEVDGLLGPLTREALTGYQTDHGMTVTAVIDEPTLDSLGMG
jgi:hypothetical protein